ncbi:MAG: right-handed parallel beta-helix repeat-containing protein [Bryobacteraceae bacterium]
MQHRRAFLGTGVTAWLAAAAEKLPESPAGPIKTPRSTSGDSVVEPDWAERMTVTVGTANAELVGSTEKVLQAAVDTVARWGGGTVKILPGTYRLRNSVFLHSNIRILGSGVDTVLIKEPSVKTKLSEDSDWYDQEVTLADASGFQVGDGICLRAKNPHDNGALVAKRTLVARSGNRFKLDRALRENFWLSGAPTASTLFPILTGEFINGVTIENIALDGNKTQNENLDGNYAGCIFIQDCSKFQIRNVTARNYNGDGISWQICHDVIVEDCHSHDNTGLGLHPGSGSQRPVIRRNKMDRNDQGLFFCWGVKFGLAEKNTITDSRRFGISIGHRDTDNLVRDNDVRGSAEVGILFRKERGEGYQPHRNRIENNRIVDVGKETAIGIDIQGPTRQITIRGNEIRESKAPGKRMGVRIGAETAMIALTDNRIEGFNEAVVDLRKKPA